ncbi:MULTISPECIES: SHOCT domain-containing protein [unclassified Nitratiruptor]|uniref:SHOCT domain-containing protein n=1 Tax=unclassified Nitratiruptor TaxID=2624044 RepID=UPI00191568B2|nr:MULTISPECIES: SHOCT domain-containing protein [unclassified Nitratiruptor]BCD60383.1 hypothetical protein NitYY0810_C1148 [Nitratiruptor sp. YY08-10]BCD64128.1 hypothetical protein NitYY0814_C0973 [Nitratiruptor sp. YY08-14]
MHWIQGHFMGFGWICIVILFAIVFYFAKRNSDKKDAKSILDERFAKGEISKEEYEEVLKTLKDH